MQHLNPEETRSCKCCQDYDEINNILGDDSGENFKAKIAKLAKYANGEPDNSDLEFQAGEMQLYDSALDEIDELLFLKETLDGIYQHQPQLYQKIVAAIAPE